MSDLSSRLRDVIAPVISFDSDIEIVKSDGVHLIDSNGKQYLDFACGIATTNIGHSHPAVLKAVHEQVDRFFHAGGVFLYDTLVTAGEKLREVTPEGIEKFFFMNAGAEAVEGAVKLARKTTGRQGIIVFRGGFHGRTMGSVTYTTSKAKYRQGYHPLLPSVFVTPFPRPFAWNMSQEDATDRALDELDKLFQHEITPGEVAAFLVEPLQGEGGYYPAGERYMRELRSIADEHGILLIADEVQTGFGRTGAWFTSQVYGVRPDVLVMGKAIASGLPLSAVGASAELFDQWPPGSHGTTFGGNPVSCASAIATIETLRDVIPGVGERSDHAFGRLNELKERHSSIGDVRGMGLMIGVDLVDGVGNPDPAAFKHLAAHAHDAGLFILSCGPNSNVIRFIPPLNVTMDQLDTGIDIIDAALTSYEG